MLLFYTSDENVLYLGERQIHIYKYLAFFPLYEAYVLITFPGSEPLFFKRRHFPNEGR